MKITMELFEEIFKLVLKHGYPIITMLGDNFRNKNLKTVSWCEKEVGEGNGKAGHNDEQCGLNGDRHCIIIGGKKKYLVNCPVHKFDRSPYVDIVIPVDDIDDVLDDE